MSDIYNENDYKWIKELMLYPETLEKHLNYLEDTSTVKLPDDPIEKIIFQDNAKKAIEDEPSDPERNLGKGSERHKTGVIGDTIGDPLKDTAGPALNPMIKVVNLLSLILAPLIVNFKFGMSYEINIILLLVLVVLTILTIWAIRKSRMPADFGGDEVETVAAEIE